MARGHRKNHTGVAVGEAFWRLAIDNAPDAVLLLDDVGRIIAANGAVDSIFGWPADEMIERSVDVLLPLGGGRERLIGDGTMLRRPAVELHCVDRQGLPVLVEAVVAAIEDAPGGRRWIACLRDISNRKSVNDVVSTAEARLDSITAHLPVVVFQRLMDPDGTIAYPFFTRGVRSVLGFEPEEMRVGAEGCLDAIHWADRADHLKAIRESAINLTPCAEEFRAISRDGEVRWLRGTSRPQRLGGGETVWDGVLIDVTESKRAEQTLEMVMDHAADCIIAIDLDGRIESVNAAVERLFGYAGREMIGQSVSMLMPEPYRSQHDGHIRRYNDSGESQIIGQGPRELVGRRKDGSLFPFETTISEVRLEGRRSFIGIGRDITRRKETEATLRETEQRLRHIAANLPGIVFQRIMRPDGRVEFPYVSEGSRDTLGIDPSEIMADAMAIVRALAPEMRERYVANLHRSATTLGPIDEDLRFVTRSGGQRWLRACSRPRPLPDASVAWEGVMVDVSDRKRAEEQLTFLAYYDPLTRVANRARFLESFATAGTRSQTSGRPLAVLSIGIDRFSIINTTLGHAVGDLVLVAVAERLKTCLKEGDTIGRAGGDRFLVLLAERFDEAEIMAAVEQMHDAVRRPIPMGDDDFEVTCSIGVGLFPMDGGDGETLVKNADAALLRAKSAGPGTTQRYTLEMNRGAMRVLSLQSRLRRALDHGEFVPYYQPQVELREGRMVGVEALARWVTHDGVIPPTEFIPVAEEYGLIDAICEQVLNACCRQLRLWQDEGLEAVPVAVNISGRQFHQPRRLFQTLESVLEDSGLDPRFLELELTESSAMCDPEAAIAVVRSLQDRGLACAIDDFGTGYSSLSVLKRFPINKLKIDRSFVMDITSDANDAAIVNAIIAMAHALKLTVVAEGVEALSHLEFLRDSGCDVIQGYLFSRPLAAADMRNLLTERRQLHLPACSAA